MYVGHALSLRYRVTSESSWQPGPGLICSPSLNTIYTLFHNHNKIHPFMDTTIQVEGPGCIEGSDRLALPGVVEHQVIYHRCARFCCRFWSIIHPCAI